MSYYLEEGIKIKVKPTFHNSNYIGKRLDEAFSKGVKRWLGSDAVVTDAWLVSFPQLNFSTIICVELKVDEGEEKFPLAYGQYKTFRNSFHHTLYIFWKDPDEMEILYWWLDPKEYLEMLKTPYKYLLLPREKCRKGRIDFIKAYMLSRLSTLSTSPREADSQYLNNNS